MSQNNRKGEFYMLTQAGRKQVAAAPGEWRRRMAILAGLLSAEKLS